MAPVEDEEEGDEKAKDGKPGKDKGRARIRTRARRGRATRTMF